MFIVSKVFWFILLYKFCYCIFLFCIKVFFQILKKTPVVKSTSSCWHIVLFVHSPYSTILPLRESSTYEHILLILSFSLLYSSFFNFQYSTIIFPPTPPPASPSPSPAHPHLLFPMSKSSYGELTKPYPSSWGRRKSPFPQPCIKAEHDIVS